MGPLMLVTAIVFRRFEICQPSKQAPSRLRAYLPLAIAAYLFLFSYLCLADRFLMIAPLTFLTLLLMAITSVVLKILDRKWPSSPAAGVLRAYLPMIIAACLLLPFILIFIANLAFWPICVLTLLLVIVTAIILSRFERKRLSK